MVKICIVTYYGLIESLKAYGNSLSLLGYTIYDFPLMKLKENDANLVFLKLVNFIKNNDINFVIWWHFENSICNENDLKYIKNETKDITKHILFNWDDPNSYYNKNMNVKCQYYDAIFSCCNEIVGLYTQKNIYSKFLLPAYDPQYNNIIPGSMDIKYKCDISFICTNLYENNLPNMEQYINRKELIDNIYKNRDKYVFNIYGPVFLKNLYPDSYKGWISYADQNILFNNSKINISTHFDCKHYQYINERTIQILGSGGLLYIDKLNGLEELLEDGKDCVYIDKNNYIEQICNILNNYVQYLDIRYNGYKKSLNYNVSNWTNIINSYCTSNLLR